MTLHPDTVDATGAAGTTNLPRTTPVQADSAPTTPRRIQHLGRGPEGDPTGARPALLALLLATALFFFYNLTSSGYANSF